MVSRWKPEVYYNRYVALSFQKSITGTTLNQISTVLQKVSQRLVLWVCASMVLQGELTLGQLIALRIISGYVMQSLVHLSGSRPGNACELERLSDVVEWWTQD